MDGETRNEWFQKQPELLSVGKKCIQVTSSGTAGSIAGMDSFVLTYDTWTTSSLPSSLVL